MWKEFFSQHTLETNSRFKDFNPPISLLETIDKKDGIQLCLCFCVFFLRLKKEEKGKSHPHMSIAMRRIPKRPVITPLQNNHHRVACLGSVLRISHVLPSFSLPTGILKGR